MYKGSGIHIQPDQVPALSYVLLKFYFVSLQLFKRTYVRREQDSNLQSIPVMLRALTHFEMGVTNGTYQSAGASNQFRHLFVCRSFPAVRNILPNVVPHNPVPSCRYRYYDCSMKSTR